MALLCCATMYSAQLRPARHIQLLCSGQLTLVWNSRLLMRLHGVPQQPTSCGHTIPVGWVAVGGCPHGCSSLMQLLLMPHVLSSLLFTHVKICISLCEHRSWFSPRGLWHGLPLHVGWAQKGSLVLAVVSACMPTLFQSCLKCTRTCSGTRQVNTSTYRAQQAGSGAPV